MANLKIKLVKSLNGRLDKHIATAESLGLRVQPLSLPAGGGEKLMAFYYNQIPLGEIDESVKAMVELWRKGGD